MDPESPPDIIVLSVRRVFVVSILVVSFLDATASLVDSFINREICSCSVIQYFSNWILWDGEEMGGFDN